MPTKQITIRIDEVLHRRFMLLLRLSGRTAQGVLERHIASLVSTEIDLEELARLSRPDPPPDERL